MKIGIVGTGRIAKRFIPEALSVEGVEIACVYNPHKGSARGFVEDVWAVGPTPVATDETDTLFGCVDAVYIASPHETHYQYIMDALDHGKHVLCEKPMVLSVSEAKTVFSVARDKGLILIEGLKTVYCPGYKKLLDVAASGMIGEIKYIDSCFTKLESSDSRELTDMKFGGSFTELGSYVCLPVIDVFGSGYQDIKYSCIRNQSRIDVFTKVDFTYGDRLATAKCGLGVKADGSLIISGTKGYIKVEAPWWKTSHFEVRFEEPSKVMSYDEEFEGDGLRYEIREFVDRIQTGKSIDSIEAGRSVCMADMMGRFLETNS